MVINIDSDGNIACTISNNGWIKSNILVNYTKIIFILSVCVARPILQIYEWYITLM